MPAPETRFAVLLFTDIVDSTELKARHGVPAYSAALSTHNAHFERLAHECLNLRTLQSRGDGYFVEAGSIAEAVRFALLFQEALRAEPWREVQLRTRIGIHAGEVSALDAEDGAWIVGPAADLAARVTDLAIGGQILLTRFPFDEARHFIREHPAVDGKAMPTLHWLAHGPYLMKGRDESLEVFEVGAEGLAPLAAPPDGGKAKRAIRPGEEETLGWRPAVGLEIPGRTGWQLTERLGAGGFGEVWVGEHAKLHQRRAFKFCFDDERLRALKREVTLVRLLRSALGERDDIVHIHELKLDTPPFYLESDLAPHGNLLQWAEKQGGLANIPLAQRIALVAHTATALAAAHSIGVLHKDIKPTNILIFDGPGGEPRPRLVDFGIGTLADFTVLNQFGVTGAGFTRATIKHSTGTPTYSPPEHLAGRPYTIQGDIYGLGVLLYQLVTAKPLDPLAPGWERDIEDALLREDIAVCVDGDPARRLPSAADLAERLLHLDKRQAEIEQQERLAREAAAHSKAEAAATAARLRATRFRKLATAFAILALLAFAGGIIAWVNQKKADRKNDEYRAMLVEAARSDRLVADEKLRTGFEREAFAYLARACKYDPSSTLAAEIAVAALNTWQHPLPTAILAGHARQVWSAQFSPDGSRIVTASEDNTARVWDVATGKSIVTLAGHMGHLWSAQFSPDGSRIVSAAEDGTARLWEAATGKSIIMPAGHEGSVFSARFSPDGSRIVTASADSTAQIWDAATGKSIVTLTGHEDSVFSAQFSPDGSRILTASEDKTARVWDAASGKSIVMLEGHEDSVLSAQFSPDGLRIATASADNTARVWDAATGKSVATLAGHGNSVWDAQFSPDGSRILTASEDKTARVWDAATGESVVTLAGHEEVVLSARFSPDGSHIVTASVDKTARIWDAASGKNVATLAGHKDSVLSAQFSPDGSRIVTASEDRTVRLWNAATDTSLVTLAGHEEPVSSARFSPDGSHIVTASADNTARVWDAATGKSVATLAGHGDSVWDAQFSPDGSHIVTASEDKTARVWDAATGESIITLAGNEGPVMNAQFSPDGLRIVTASADKTAWEWDAATGQRLATIARHQDKTGLSDRSPDGLRIVTNSFDYTARLWAVGVTGSNLLTSAADQRKSAKSAPAKPFATLAGHEAEVLSVQFSPDGSRIATASADKTARVWDVLPARTGPPPDWFADFLCYLAQMQLDQTGELETLDPGVMRERMRWVRRGGAGQDTPYLRILRRFVPE